jgi:hypothetical protein
MGSGGSLAKASRVLTHIVTEESQARPAPLSFSRERFLRGGTMDRCNARADTLLARYVAAQLGTDGSAPRAPRGVLLCGDLL